MDKYSLFTDAGSRGNPGKASYGVCLFKKDHGIDKLLDFDGRYLGIKTNNQGEFTALKEGITLAIKHNIKNLDCFSDSELLIKQINHEYKVKDPHLKGIIKEIYDLSGNFDTITFTHVRREYNKFADKMVNIVLDAAG